MAGELCGRKADMTLITGRVEGEKIYILGDTQLTFHNQKKANPFVEGCLKQYLISDHLALGFAGVREHFEQVLPEFLNCQSGQEIVERALDAQSEGSNFDLLVGEVGYDKIRFVRDGVLSEREAGYIGDSEAFNAFQTAYHDFSEAHLQAEMGRVQFQILKLPEPVTEGDIYSRLFSSLKKVIWDTNISGVGGLVVPLCTDDGRFQYLNYADVTSDPLNIENFGDEPKSIEFGTAAGGGYSVEFSDDTPYGGQGRNVGLYFLQGGFGVVFPPNEQGLRNAELVRAKNPAFWVLNTGKKLGHAVASGYLTEDHCGIAGEELLQAERYQDALFCYELRKDSKTLKDRPVVYDRYLSGYATAMFNCGRAFEAVDILATQTEKHPDFKRCKDLLNQMLQACDYRKLPGD